MKTLIVSVLAFGLLVLAIGAYLSPDGLRACGAQPSDTGDCRKVDAIVAISGGDTVARTGEAIRLYENGWGSRLVFSGAAADKSGPSNAEAMKRQALAAGVPSGAILIDEFSETTKQNAANTTDLIAENDITSVIVVTSAYHQRRAGLEFGERAGTSVRVVNHPVASDNQWSGFWWSTPTGWWLATSELVKIGVFYAGGSR